MARRTVLYQSLFRAPFVAAVLTPQFTTFDQPRAPQFSAADQQFSAWHSPFFGTKTPITPEWTAFDTPQAPKYSATEQQFSTWHSPFFGTKTPNYFTETPYDAPQAPKYSAAEQQFSAFHSPFFGTKTPAYAAGFVPFDAPQAPKYAADLQDFGGTNYFVAPTTPTISEGGAASSDIFVARTVVYPANFDINFTPSAPITTLIGPLTATPFDTPQTPNYRVAEVQFTAFSGMVFSPPVEMGTDFDVPVQEPVPANIQQFDTWHSLAALPPVTLIAAFTSTPFDVAKAPQYAAGEQQFTAWHSPFFGTRTPTYAAGFVPFDTPQAPQFNAAEQQFAVLQYPFTIPANTPSTESFFTPFDVAFRPSLSPGLVQFIDFGMGPEVTTTAPATIGRWGPDETKEERRRRHAAGIFFQWEEMPARSEFAPDPVEHQPHEPQKWADEPAAVRTGAKASPVSGVEFAQVLNEQIDAETWDDPEILNLIEKFLENGTRR